MKKTIVGIALCLIVCMGAILSGQTVTSQAVTKSHATTKPKEEIILTLQSSAKTTAATADTDYIKVDFQIAVNRCLYFFPTVIGNVGKPLGTVESIVVIKADPKKLFRSVMPLLKVAGRAGLHENRLEAGEIHGRVNPPDRPIWRTDLPVSEIVWPIRIGVLDGKDAGQFAIWDRKIKDAKALTRDLTARKKASGNKPRLVVVSVEPKAIWVHVVQTCKAVENAGFKYVGILNSLQEHSYRPKPKGATKPQATTKPHAATKPQSTTKPKASDPKKEIIFTLRSSAKTTTASADTDQIKVAFQVSADESLQVLPGLIRIVGRPITDLKSRSIAVIKADPKKLFRSVMPLLRVLVRGEIYQERLEADEIHATVNNYRLGRTGAIPGELDLPGSEIVWPISIAVLDGKDAGQFAIWDRKIKDVKALTRDLAARKKAPGKKPRLVTVAAEPKAVWVNVVQACKAVEDAGFKYVGFLKSLEEHRYRPKPKQKFHKPAGETAERIPQ